MPARNMEDILEGIVFEDADCGDHNCDDPICTATARMDRQLAREWEKRQQARESEQAMVPATDEQMVLAMEEKMAAAREAESRPIIDRLAATARAERSATNVAYERMASLADHLADPLADHVGSGGARQSAVAPKDDRARTEALKLGSRLAELVSRSPDGKLTPEMRALAAGICSTLGGSSSESRPGRAFAKDLVPGGLYIGKWASGEFEWTYVGPVPGDPARMTIKRADGQPSVELLGDHGLAPYDEKGKFWHPANWTEGTGVGESTGRMVSDAAGRDIGTIEMSLGEEDGF